MKSGQTVLRFALEVEVTVEDRDLPLLQSDARMLAQIASNPLSTIREAKIISVLPLLEAERASGVYFQIN